METKQIMRTSVAIAALGLMSLTSLPAGAGFRLAAGAEHFKWEEVDSGGRLLEETGPRFHVGFDWDNREATRNAAWFAANGRLYFGSVDYDGQACDLSGNCVPAQSNTEYVGLLVEGFVGTPLSGNVDFLAGLGIDTWDREIQSTIDASGRAVSGASETYTILYAKLGLGTGGPAWRLQGGIKYPFYTDEYVDTYGISLSPKGRISGFARWETRLAERMHLALYYDSYRFGESDPEFLVSGGSLIRVWQPESNMDVFGAQLQFGF